MTHVYGYVHVYVYVYVYVYKRNGKQWYVAVILT